VDVYVEEMVKTFFFFVFVDGKIQTALQKVSVMVQATLDGFTFDSFAMKSEVQVSVFRCGWRLLQV
jgi:hypothetical protein